MRALFVIKSLGLPGGGAEKILSDIGSALADRGHEILVASFDRPGTKDFYSFAPPLIRARLSVGDASAHSGPLDFARKARVLRQLITERRPDVAIGFMHSSFVPLVLATLGSGVPVIGSEHTTVDHYRTRRLQFQLVRWSAGRFAAFTVPSERVRHAYPPCLRSRMTVIPNPVSIPRRPGQGLCKSGRTLLAVGGLREEKGHALLVSAFESIAAAFPEWTLRLVGDGSCRRALELQVARSGLAGRVVFAGALADVASEYAAADLLAVPSTYEGFGLATAEAMAYAVPVIGFADCPGTNELIVDNVNGILVARDDHGAALAKGLAELMQDARLRRRLGANGPASVAQYSLHSVTRQWEALLKAVVEISNGRFSQSQ